jgi:predicted metal-dependent phosphoesterase TrpH
MLFDIHTHTSRYSPCSILRPQDLLKRAAELNLDGLVITEHGFLWARDEIEALREETETHLIVLRGQEVTCYRENGSFHGDLLVFGYDGLFEERMEAARVIEAVHGEGGAVVAAHPYRFGYGFGDDVFHLELDGIEVLHPSHYPEDIRRAEHARRVLDIAGLGSGDAHDLHDVGYYLTSFSGDIRTEEDMIREIREKTCRAVALEEILLKTKK